MGEESDRLVDPDFEAETFPGTGGYAGSAGTEYTSGLLRPGASGAGIGSTSPYNDASTPMYSDTALNGYDIAGDDTDPDAELEQTRAQIEETRSQMSSTIDAIQEKLSPANIAQQAKDTVKEATVGKAQEMVSNAGNAATDMVSNAGTTAKGFGSNLVETIRGNPVPAAIAGLGLGWLFMSGRKQSSSDNTYGNGYPAGYNPGQRGQYGGYGTFDYSGTGNTGSSFGGQQGQSGGFVGQAQSKVSDAASGVQDTASQVAGNVQDAASQVAGTVQDTASQVASSAQYGAQKAQSAFQQSLNSNPLAVGVVALALGAAVGLSIPETDKENQLLGETRDNVVQQAQETVQEKAHQVQTVAQEAVGAAKDAASDSAQSQGLTS
jgi:uncharacterized protein YjbJ (UPF0337 family)